MRPSLRAFDELRKVSITRHYTKYAEGSVFIECGGTKIICTATVTEGVPPFLKGKGEGWITAEYSMLPRATLERTPREATRGRPTGRTQEIQRLIGRSLRAAVDMRALGENSILIDCDVIQADGGTRTASITGGCVALYDAIAHLYKKGKLVTPPFKQFIAAVSAGVYKGEVILDLDYTEDANADTDMNIVLCESGNFIELQGTAEHQPFKTKDIDQFLVLAQKGAKQLFELQRHILDL